MCPSAFTAIEHYLKILATALVLLAATACSKPEPVRIGFVAGLSGRVADLGVAGRNGAILAVEKRNAAGGINGRPIELLIRDDEQNIDTARRVVKDLIDLKAEGIVGHMTSSMSAATLPLANEHRMLMLSPTSTSIDFSGKDDYFLRVIQPTTVYATQSAHFHRNILKQSRIAMIYDVRNRSYSESWLNDFKSAFEKAGGKIVRIVPFESGESTHFNPLARQLLEDKPEGIMILANSVDAAMLCQQIRAFDPKVQIGTSEWAGTERLIELGGKAVEGVHVAQFLDRNNQNPAFVVFLKEYRKRFTQDPGFAGVTSFDATNVLLDALAQRKPGQSVKEAILALRRFNGLSGLLEFDNHGDTSRGVVLTEIRNGKFETLK